MNLDDADYPDPQDALGDVLRTCEQWRGAAELDVSVALHPDVQAVLVVGMGGSGIAGDVAAVVGAASLDVPVVVHKGYGVPNWVSGRTLVIAASHSGGTEETLDALGAAHKRGARLAAVTSGGEVEELVDPLGPVAHIPGDGQPRHNIGWLAGGTLRLLGLDDGLRPAQRITEELAVDFGPTVHSRSNAAKRVAARIADGGTTLIWGAPGLAGVAAYRLSCQLNENAELPAVPMSLPELNHNAVVGWQHEESSLGVGGLMVVRDTDEHPRMQARVTASLPLVRERVRWVVELLPQGDHQVARLASLVMKADLVSLYTAFALDRDPTPIAAINQLKSELAQGK